MTTLLSPVISVPGPFDQREVADVRPSRLEIDDLTYPYFSLIIMNMDDVLLVENIKLYLIRRNILFF